MDGLFLTFLTFSVLFTVFVIVYEIGWIRDPDDPPTVFEVLRKACYITVAIVGLFAIISYFI